MPARAKDAPTPDAWCLKHAGDAVVAMGNVPPGSRFRRHAHEGLHLCGVLAGGFVERAARGHESAGPGTVRLSPSASHDIDFGPAGARCVVIHFPVPPEGLALDRSSFHADPWLAALLRRVPPAVAADATRGAAALDHCVAEMLAQLLRRKNPRASSTPPGWLRGVRDALLDGRGEAVALDDLARPFGIHRAHLARAFRDHYGVTIGAFVRRLRVERAVGLLHDRERTLADVALDAGFADQSHMTRAFAAVLQTTPGRLRREGGKASRIPRPPRDPMQIGFKNPSRRVS